MSESMDGYKEIPINIGDKKTTLALGRCGIALFRLEPEKDYIDVWEEVGDEEEHHWVFKNREFLLWLGGVCLDQDDLDTLEKMNETNGLFTTFSGGWRPPVIVEDKTSPSEAEMYVRSNLSDLGDYPPNW